MKKIAVSVRGFAANSVNPSQVAQPPFGMRSASKWGGEPDNNITLAAANHALYLLCVFIFVTQILYTCICVFVFLCLYKERLPLSEIQSWLPLASVFVVFLYL